MRLSPWGVPGRWAGALTLAVAVAAVGCGGGGGKGDVSGKVTYKGVALKGGRVVFATSTKQNVLAEIGEDGNYTAPAVATGPAKVSVETSYMKTVTRAPQYQPPKDQKFPEGYKAGSDAGLSKRYVKIPEKYESPDTSGLTLDVKRGSQTFDIKLD